MFVRILLFTSALSPPVVFPADQASTPFHGENIPSTPQEVPTQCSLSGTELHLGDQLLPTRCMERSKPGGSMGSHGQPQHWQPNVELEVTSS